MVFDFQGVPISKHRGVSKGRGYFFWGTLRIPDGKIGEP